MSAAISPNTQAILLLTAPLIIRGGEASADLLPLGLYKKLARHLRELDRQPADLLGAAATTVIADCGGIVDADRLQRLLARGFQLAQAIEHWQARAIWVVSRADPLYPRRLKHRLREDAPPLLYGCGAIERLDDGGLAVVGSRDADADLIAYAEAVGTVAARSGVPLVSGGARGVDQAAMRGAAGGQVVGVLADSLEKGAMLREHRAPLMDGRLVLVSPYDPGARFNVGHAMQRNKLIYALADAALVVNADEGKGGTWAGAIEQLGRLRFVPVYVRQEGARSAGLEALRRQGALPWPEPRDADGFADVFRPEGGEGATAPDAVSEATVSAADGDLPAARLWRTARPVLIALLAEPQKEAAVAAALDISPAQARAWLARLVADGEAIRDGSGRYAAIGEGSFAF